MITLPVSAITVWTVSALIEHALGRPAEQNRLPPGLLRDTPQNGHALPKLNAVLKNKKTIWTNVVVTQWYDAQQPRLLVATGEALWYHTGIAPVPIRWVLICDPSGEQERAAFLSTDLGAQPAAILGWLLSRWRVQATFQEGRSHLGVETQRQWSRLATLRTTPAVRELFSLITVWPDGLARDAAKALRPNAAA